MVSISDQNPEIRIQTDGQQTPATTPTPAQQENNAGIFRVGLTLSQAQSEGLNSLFTKYNTDGDDKISQIEFDAYTRETSNQEQQEEVTSNQQQQDITSKSGARTAVGGVYTIQKGDALSVIAKDFGMTVDELYQANTDVLESVDATIQVGQKLKVSKTTGTESTESTQSPKKTKISQSKKSTAAKTSSPEASAQAVNNEKMAELMKSFGIDINSDDTKTMIEKVRGLDENQKHKIIDDLVNIYVDFDKVNKEFLDVPLDKIAVALGIPEKEWKNADWDKQGTLLADVMNKKYKSDLNHDDPNSGFNKALKRLKESGPTDRERELYGNHFDFDNLTEENYVRLAELSVTQGYISTSLAIAHKNLENGNNKEFAAIFDSYMKSLFKDQDTMNFLMFIGGEKQEQLKEYLSKLTNEWAEASQIDERSNSMLQALALNTVANNADAEHLKMLYQNNPNMENTINEVLKYTAENTTDETRKTMLNNIVENSSSITQGNNSNSGISGKGGPASAGGLGMSNPIQQNASQINYINSLKEASANFHNNINNSFDSDIPEEYKSALETIKEYQDFKGTGLTVTQYQRAKSALKNNFTSMMNHVIKNYASMPNKFKPIILRFFDALDNEKSCELYLNGSNEVRTFMNRYNYMNNSKLLQHVAIHPADYNSAPKAVQDMIDDARKEEEKA